MKIDVDKINYKPQEFRHKLGILELDKMPTPMNNMVIVKPHIDYSRTNSGILVPESYMDESQHSVRCSEVVVNPRKLVTSKDVKHDKAYPGMPSFMEWKCDIETKPGDIIIHDYLDSMNCYKFKISGSNDLCYMIPYDGIYLIIRNGAVIVPNGYIILEEIINKKKYIDVVVDEVDPCYARVKYIGKPVEYLNKSMKASVGGLKRGDVVLLGKNQRVKYHDPVKNNVSFRRIYLEISYHSYLGENLFRVKPSDILAVIKDYKSAPKITNNAC